MFKVTQIAISTLINQPLVNFKVPYIGFTVAMDLQDVMVDRFIFLDLTKLTWKAMKKSQMKEE